MPGLSSKRMDSSVNHIYTDTTYRNLPVVCIVGSPRSGTKCLCGALRAAGLYTGDISGLSSDIIKGSLENSDIKNLHDKILDDNHCTWENLPSTINYSKEHREHRDAILKKFKIIANSWLFNDPRNIYLLDFWREKLANLQLVGIFRHPLNVAMSLYQREAIPIRKGIKIWLQYNKRILIEYKRSPFPLIYFDANEKRYLSDLNELRKTLNQRHEGLKLSWDLVKRCYDNTLINQSAPSPFYPENNDQNPDVQYQSLIKTSESVFNELIELTNTPTTN